MSAPLHRRLAKDLYQILRLPRTATTIEIKQSYRAIALALHPDRHGGCETKTDEFKEVSEAYRILSDHASRAEYDRWLDGVTVGADGTARKTGASRAAERNPFYRKVYSPAAPPGMKTFDRKRHYDMHYGDGMMKEEIERARKRAEAASPRKSGFSYQSPLGAGFSFDRTKSMGQQTNPYSRRGKRQHDHLNEGGYRIEYEEAHFDLNGGDLSQARRVLRGKEHVVERMHDRRRSRKRERGDPYPYRTGRDGEDAEAGGSGCVVM
ncbi:hypothetical protein ACHAWF_018513 [Thalassiosira exigua]